MTTDRADRVGDFAARYLVDEPAVWAERRALGERLRPGMQMSAYEGALCAWLLRLHGARHVLEIGSFVGLSALWLASALPENGSIASIEIDPATAAHARETLRLAGEERVRIVESDALEFLKQDSGSYDALFIDGEKKQYPDILERALPRLTPGALILVDNSFLFGAMLEEEPRHRVSAAQREAMERLHRLLADKHRFDTSLIPTVEGLSVAVYKA